MSKCGVFSGPLFSCIQSEIKNQKKSVFGHFSRSLICSFNPKNQEQTHIYNFHNEVAQRINEFKNERVMPVEMNLDDLSG